MKTGERGAEARHSNANEVNGSFLLKGSALIQICLLCFFVQSPLFGFVGRDINMMSEKQFIFREKKICSFSLSLSVCVCV